MSDIAAGQVLNEAKKLLEQGWCQGAYTRSGMGREVALRSSWGKSWCPSGATWKAAQRLGVKSKLHPAVINAFLALQRACAKHREQPRPGREIADWNDASERTHAEVLQMMDEAILSVSPFVVMVEKESK